jgi:hypothetical protein
MFRKSFAKLFAMVRRGDAEADYYLRQVLLDEVHLPAAKHAALGWLLLHPIKRQRGRGREKVANQDRDFIGAQAVLRAIAASGLDATRTTAAASGSSVVAEALKRLELPRMTERTINRIWFAHTKREREEEWKTAVLLP